MILIYGANGYVGRLAIAEAKAQKLDIVAAGRSAAAVSEVAREFEVPSRAGGVDTIELAGVTLVVNLAGPFERTAHGLATRCIEAGVHYVDIAGEVAEFESVRSLDSQASAAGVALMPGVGFGVVPTDCLALHVASQLEAPTSVDLAFFTDGGVSAGTLATMTARFGDVAELGSRPLERRKVEFDAGTRLCVENPWRADLLTATASTGVEDVTAWIALPRPVMKAMESAHRRGDVTHPPLATRLLRRASRMLPAGPSASALAKGSAHVWAQAVGAEGATATATLRTPDAYVHTVDAATWIASNLPNVGVVGFVTPAQVFGADFVLDLPEVERHDR